MRKQESPENFRSPAVTDKKHPLRTIIYIGSIILGLLLVIIYFVYFKKRFSKSSLGPPPMEQEVSVIQVKKEKVEIFLELPARISPTESAEVRPQVSGIIQDIAFTEGSFIHAGDQLYQIDPKTYILAHEKAKAQVNVLRLKKERLKTVVKDGGASQQDLDDVTALLAQAEAGEKDAKLDIERSKVYAPISGYISTTNVNKGALVLSGQQSPLANITNLKTVYADMVIPSKNWLQYNVKRGARVVITADENEMVGKLTVAGVIVDESSDTIKLRAEFDNERHKLLPGMFVNVKLYTEPFSAILIPQRVAVRTPDGELSVWLVQPDKTITLRPIKVIGTKGHKWVIKEGLKDGESLIPEGLIKMKEGMKVNPVYNDALKK